MDQNLKKNTQLRLFGFGIFLRTACVWKTLTDKEK